MIYWTVNTPQSATITSDSGAIAVVTASVPILLYIILTIAHIYILLLVKSLIIRH